MSVRHYIVHGDSFAELRLRGEIGILHSEQPEDPNKVRLSLLDHETEMLLVAPRKDVSALSPPDMNLLRGVSSLAKRCEVFQNRLTEVRTIGLESAVLVNMDGTAELDGVVRYKGELSPGTSGTYFGVELLDTYGNTLATDGNYLGKVLFPCRPGQGVFVSAEKLRPNIRGRERARIYLETGAIPAKEAGSQFTQQWQDNATDTSTYGAGVHKGMRVVAGSDSGKEVQGTVRFVGEIPVHGPDRKLKFHHLVGLETDKPHNMRSVPVEKGHKFFHCKETNRLFVPVQAILPIQQGSSRNQAFWKRVWNGITWLVTGDAEDHSSSPSVVETNLDNISSTARADHRRQQNEYLQEQHDRFERLERQRDQERLRQQPQQNKDSIMVSEQGTELDVRRLQEQRLAEVRNQQFSTVQLEQQRLLDEARRGGGGGSGNRAARSDEVSQLPGRGRGSTQYLLDQARRAGSVATTGGGQSLPHEYRNLSETTFNGQLDRGSAYTHHGAETSSYHLEVGSMVEFVEKPTGELRHGHIRWIGWLPNNDEEIAGIELDVELRGCTDGTFKGKHYFRCPPGRALFYPLRNCHPDKRFQDAGTEHQRRSSNPTQVNMFGGAGASSGPNSMTGHETNLSVPEALLTSKVCVNEQIVMQMVEEIQRVGALGSWEKLAAQLGFRQFDIDEIWRESSDSYGRTVAMLWRWTSHQSATVGQLARALVGVNCDDVAVTVLSPMVSEGGAGNRLQTEEEVKLKERTKPEAGAHPPIDNEQLLCGGDGYLRGIQGHHNSCYMDATLFAMFSFSMAFDGILHDKRKLDAAALDVRDLLRESIVNPLRINGYVSYHNIMELRSQFDKLGQVADMTTAEKDPEEFLNLMWRILGAQPFLSLKSPQHDDNTFIYQLFVQKDPHFKVPTVQRLLERSFLDAQLQLGKMPSVLVLQLPRYGRAFKPHEKILPSLELKMSNLLQNGARLCYVCGGLANVYCPECRHPDEAIENQDGNFYFHHNNIYINFCKECSEQVHHHKDRSLHNPRDLRRGKRSEHAEYGDRRLDLIADEVETMELFAVICIETSHYVSFVKCGSGPDAPWCFFDSMADRRGEQDGNNIPRVTLVKEFLTWVRDPKRVEETPARAIQPQEVRRLLCDPYMCLYQKKELLLHV